MKNNILYFVLAGLLFMMACSPQEDDKIDIGAVPQAAFSSEKMDENNYQFTNTTTDDHFITNWDFGSLGTFKGDVVDMNFPFIGDYDVTLTVFGRGGSGSTTQTITITQDDPSACLTDMMLITNCSEKIWKLNPSGGALWVGPGDGTTWWANSDADVTGRPCDWNDEYKFYADGTYIYEANGDLWGEGYMGFGGDQCYDIDELPADRAAWKSGTHSFEIIPATDSTPRRLRVIGEGAFVGLRKAANGMEVSFPQSEVTYDIIDARVEGGRDIIELEVYYGAGYWRFTLASEG